MRKINLFIFLICIFFIIPALSSGQSSVKLPEVSLVEKPSLSSFEAIPEKLARVQPPVPEGWREVPFEETAPDPVLTPQEKKQGFMLFQRLYMEPVYANTKPLAGERLRSLVAFAAPGEFEPLTLGVYPVRPLKNLRIIVSPLKSASAEIPASAVETRLVTCWNIRYPGYSSTDTWRHTPELLEKVTEHSSPSGECQRWWLKIHVPENARPGLYRGTVTVFDDGCEKAVAVPLLLRVLGFKLEKDPNKHFTAYYYDMYSVVPNSRSKDNPEWLEKAMANEYRTMVEYGFDMLPTGYLRADENGRAILRHPEMIGQMMQAGMKGPYPVTADAVVKQLYNKMSDGTVGAHWAISKMPPDEFYTRLTEVVKAFEKERKANGWPEFIYCPVDEVHVSARTFGMKVYAAMKAAGVRTYITKDPKSPDAADYAPSVDIWCSQPYSTPYEKVVSSQKYEYWCYPNHVAGEVKNPRVMCRGGRMTYGYGFWRSGYSTLIPWHWRWQSGPDPFDYLKGNTTSGCGQRIDDDGTVIPTAYWECFREGYDDARYIYTLENTIVRREGSTDPACRKLTLEGRKLLQGIWSSIRVQEKYMDDGLWASGDFDAWRWRMAALTEKLNAFPALNRNQAPSVLVGDTKAGAEEAAPVSSPGTTGEKDEILDLGDNNFARWKSGTTEGKTAVTDKESRHGGKCLKYEVLVDHNVDGGEGGKYPVGWPRLVMEFSEGELDLTRYDYLSFWLKVDSNRDEVADDSTPFSINLRSYPRGGSADMRMDIGDHQREWIPFRIPVTDLIGKSPSNSSPWKSLRTLQFGISEANYTHGARLVFYLDEISLVKLKTPRIRAVSAPLHIWANRPSLPVSFDLLGMAGVQPGSYTLRVSLLDSRDKPVASSVQDLEKPNRITLEAGALSPGNYQLRLEIRDKSGKVCSSLIRNVLGLDGPESVNN
ncbi:MAG: DUF6067 family protein [Candidatus Latescibacter sp.]|nr:DUF6067 family protein [Candidatus Latescibacter sp.]